MASSILILLLLLLTSLFIASSSSTQQQLLLPLTHTHSRTRSPTRHLLKSSSLRSSSRHGAHHLRGQRHQQVSLPLSSGSDYTLTLSVGPATSVDLYMDTGSDLVWFPCSPFKCILCDGKSQSPPPPPPQNSSLVSCSDPSCSAAHSSASSSDLCSVANCPLEDIETSSCAADRYHCPRFYYAYGDGSLIARLRRGPLSLNSLSVPNFTFACAHSALAEPVGVAGFGRGILSLPNQLSTLTPSLGGRFSYCLISHSFQQARLIKPSPLILGRTVEEEEEEVQQPNSSFRYQTKHPFIYTPMLRNPKYPYFYSVALLAISVGNTRISTESNLIRVDREGNGGMVVDSGTTFTMLPSRLYSKVTAEFSARMDASGFERAEKAEAETGLRPCYYYYSGRNDSRAVPGMGLHFGGNADVELPRRNYFVGFERGRGGGERVGCLMLMDGGGDEAGGPAGTLGNFQQQGFEVVYDLEVGRVGFARRRCASLWDEMSRGG